MRSPLDEELERSRTARAAAGLARQLDDGTERGVDFVSNDYLGLARDPRLIEAAAGALRDHGAGGRAARLLGGGSPLQATLEGEAADWLGAQAALLFPSGYQANLGLIGALVGRGDAILTDALIHASLIDAARLSRAHILVHRHLDLEELERRLIQVASARRRLVLTEGIFSMDGDRAPLAKMAELCARHDAHLIVDEAHAVGLLGPQGRGAWASEEEREGLPEEVAQRVVARVVTGGKALGANGALVAGSRALIDELTDRARSFVFTTAAAPATAAALGTSISIVRDDCELRAEPLKRAASLARSLDLLQPAAAIVPVHLGSASNATDTAAGLQSAGLDVRAVRPPTVPPGTARLRIVCHAFNTDAELDELTRRLGNLGEDQATATALTKAAEVKAAHQPVFVIGTDTDIGKTVVAAAFFHAARTKGDARYWKPVQTGTDSDTETVAYLSGAAPYELLRPAWSFPLPASPHAAAKQAGARIEPQRLDEALEGLLRTLPDSRLVVELAGGLLVPYTDEGQNQADWVARARPRVVLVARAGLGTLNHTMLTLEALRARHIEAHTLVLVGEPHPSNFATLVNLGDFRRVIQCPKLAPLTPGSLQTWSDETNLAALWD